MGIRADLQGTQVDINQLKIKFGKPGEDCSPWYNPNEGAEEEEQQQTTDKVEQKVHIPNLSPRIVAAGGRVRIRQPDGSLRMYDINVGDYVE